MLWRVGGHHRTTGKPWQVVILARSAADAAAQARNLGRGDPELIEPKSIDQDPAPATFAFASLAGLMLLPMMVLALLMKAGLLAASELRRLIIPQ